MRKWTLFSNHGHVLLFLANDPEARLRDVAQSVGITERAVQKIVRDLQDGGILSVSKHGRRNRYRVHTRKSLRHPLEAHRTVGNLISMMREDSKSRSRKPPKVVVAAPIAASEPEPEVVSEPEVVQEPVEDSHIEPIPDAVAFDDEFSDPPFDPDPEPAPEWLSDDEITGIPVVEPDPEPESEPGPESEPEPEPEQEPEQEQEQSDTLREQQRRESKL